MSLVATTKLQVNYYNPRTLSYEPFLEPWTLRASVDRESAFTE